MTTSMAMISAVPESTVLMITDWASRSTLGMKEQVVPIVNPEAVALIYNTPPSKGLRVLDLDSGTGVHGMVAAQRGATSATLFFTDKRAQRFARFSTWLNGLSGLVSTKLARSAMQAVKSGLLPTIPGSANLTAGFGLLLAQPPFMPVPDDKTAASFPRNGGQDGKKALKEVFQVADKVLSPTGMLALVTEFGLPDSLPSSCSGYAVPGLMGSLILRSGPLNLQAFAQAHSALGPQGVQVGNMKLHGIDGVSSGMLFAKRVSKQLLSSEGCGPLSLQSIPDPIAWPKPGDDQFLRPCFLSQETNCPDTA
jgi:16S rRNA G966 N2-methylase RsmD